MSASYDADRTPPRRDPLKMIRHTVENGCPKCGAHSGDDWSQCGKSCPVPGSPHFDEVLFKEEFVKAKL